ncbi:Uma2 family endonuclease [Streptomyces sp. NPDC002851]
MSAQPVERPRSSVTYEQLQNLAETIEAAADNQGQRVRADIANEEITVHMMSPSTKHGHIVYSISKQIGIQDESIVGAAEGRVHHPELGLCRTADLLLMTQEVFEEQDDDDFATFGPDVSVAIEVVSRSNPGNDYLAKLREYPRMGVPIYVIIDPRDGTVTVYSDPDTAAGEPRYRDTSRKYKFGDTVQMGAWTIDTAKFPRY